jgi:hypothetical protein
MHDEEALLEKQLVEMLTIAGEYCLALEHAEQASKQDLIQFLLKAAPILYLKGLLFPVMDEPEDEGDERMVTEEQWEQVFLNLRDTFGEDDTFQTTDYKAGDGGIQTASLSELFADVYQDMKDFAWLMTRNTTVSRNWAAFNIGRYFRLNWGAKVLLAQSVLHAKFLSRTEESDEELY